MANRILNEGPEWVIVFLWLGANIGMFIGYFFRYYAGTEYYYTGQLMGPSLAVARASAASLNLNCMLILLPVCRNLISFLRGSMKCCKRNLRRQLDKNIKFHKAVAYMICFFTAVHYYAHVFNFERLVIAWKHPDNNTRGLLSALSSLPTDQNGTWVNPIRDPNADPIREVMKSIPGITGVVITLSLVLIISSSTEFIRRSYFEVFWFTHHVFILFFIGLVLHGIGGVVRNQSNLAEHDPKVCAAKYAEWGKPGGSCPVPQFAPGSAQTWKWVLAPMVLYLIERIIRFYRSQQLVIISKVVKHPSRVIELQLQKKGFSMQPGQYIFLHCPSISRLEWHPFTLTSAPQDDHFSVHIRTVGDWTNALAKACACDEAEFKENWKLPSVAVDGPFGTASEDVYRYQVGMFIGAGIGVTPFASVLKDIWYKCCDPNFEMKLQKVYFYWICPDTNAFEWFSDLLKSLEEQMLEMGKGDFLTYNIYLTRGWNPNQAKNIYLREQDQEDAITGLQQKTHYGRPNWEAEFGKVATSHPEVSVGVFFCGPKVLSRTLKKMSNEHTSGDPKGVKFFYNKENF